MGQPMIFNAVEVTLRVYEAKTPVLGSEGVDWGAKGSRGASRGSHGDIGSV